MAYYFVDENGRVTKKEASKKKKKNQPSYTVDLEGNVTKLEAEIDEELAPVKKTTDAKERTWFQGSDLFDDGYQVGDVLKTAFSSTRDLGQNMTKGLVGIAEKTVDAGAFIAGGVGNLLGADEFAGSMRNFVKKDLIDEEKVAKYITGNVLLEKAGLDMENDSVFGEKTDSLAESAGQLGGTVALQAIGVPWYLTTGVTSFGGEAESALKKGASYGEAAVSAAVTTAVELLTEKMFGGSGLGEKGLINTSALTKGITNKALKALAAFGVDMAAEGSEEVVSEFASTLGQQLTYEREDTIAELLNNEEAMDDYIRKVGESLFGEEARAAYGEAFIGGAVLGGGMNAGKVAGSIKNKTDYNTGLNSNEEAVFNREYESRIAEEEKGGKKLTQKQKDAIYDEVMDDLGRGRVSTDTIESVLGGETYKAFEEGVTGFDESETYKAYQEAVAEEKAIREEFETLQNMKAGEATIGQQDRYNELKARIAEFETKSKSKELRAQLEPEIQRINALKRQLQAEVAGKVQGDRLSESYRELQRSTEKFQADPAKYKDEHARKTIQNLIDGGIANNTREFHEFADMLAKWSEDKGLEFDAVDNKKLAGTRYAVQGATVNAYVTEDGKIAFNVDSKKRLNSLAGHEITHVLEGTGFYDTLSKAVQDYATKKGEWDTRLKATTELYKKYNPEADPVKELTADLVGDYIFTDKAFLETLSVNHRNVFQKIYDEIKYMVKTATAGSKEARLLLKAQKSFADAYRASGKVQAKAGTGYSLTEYTDHQKQNWSDSKRIVVYESPEQLASYVQDSISGKIQHKKMYFGAISSDLASRIEADTGLNVENYNLSLGSDEILKVLKDHGTERTEAPRGQRAVTEDDFSHIVDVVLNPTKITLSDTTYNGKPAIIFTGEYNGRMNVTAVVSDKRLDLFVQTMYVNVKRENLSTPIGEQAPINTPEANSGTVSSADSIAENSEKSSGEAKNLSPEQEEFFKDSVVRDENGKLKVMYHGTSKGGHTVFDPYGAANYGLFGAGSYFTDSKEVAESYTKKGKGTNPEVYETYLNITNPIDMDAPADPAAWKAALPEADFPESGTNEDFYRAMEEYFEDMEYPRWEAAQTAMEVIEGMGYDGITHIGGGRVNAEGPRHQVYIAFQPEQIKRVDNVKPTGDADIRYSISEATDGDYLDAVNRGDMETARRMVDEAAKNAGYTISAYHGTPNADFNVFDKERVGKGNDQYGAGFYFATDKETATHYGGRVISAALDIKKPIRITVTSDSGANLIDANIELTSKQAYEVVKRLPGINDPEESVLGDYYDQYWEVGPKAWMIRDLAEQYRDVGYLDSDLFRNYPNELHEALRDVVGYDGVEVTFESTGEKFYVAWFDNQMKSTDAVTYDDNGNVIPLSERFQHDTPDIRRSLSRDGEAPVRGDGYAVYGENVRVRDPAELDFAPLGEYVPPMQEDVAPVAEVAADTNVSGNSEEMDGYAPISAEEAGQRDAGIAFPGDADVPPEVDAPYYGEDGEELAPTDPFENRDMKDVGKRSVKAYMYENPEVKPFFQAEANVMLGELERTTKGERVVDAQVLYDTNGEAGVYGTKRHTSDDIAYLRDSLNYSYAEIEKGLKAIIEDDGKENNAVSKRIEFLLNDRLLNGYSDMDTGYEYPPNQEYVNLLNEKQITEYNEEARARFFENADAYVPPMEDIAPVAAPAPAAYDIAPVREEYEAITPEKQKYGGKLVRVDNYQGKQQKLSPEFEKIAEVLDAEPETVPRKARAWAKFKANFLDKGAVFEDLALKKKNRELIGKWNYMLYSEARAQRLMGSGAEGVKSMNAIIEEVGDKAKAFYEYLYHVHNIDRMTLADRFEGVENKPVFGDSVTADVSREAVKRYEAENPMFKQYAEDVYAYNAHLRDLLVENGVVSPTVADLWAEMYPHYVPIRRAGDHGLNINVPLDTGRTGVNAPVKRATGGNSDILPLFDTMAQRTVQTYRAIAKNSFGVELKNTLGTTISNEQTSVDEMIDSIDEQDGLLQEGKNGRNPTFTVFDGGEKVTYEITEDMYDALKPMSEGMAYTNKVLNTASNFHRGLLTEYNPVFMITNAVKDVQDLLINSQHAMKTYAKIPEAFAQLVRKGYWYNEYMEAGGDQNTYFDNETNTFKTENKGIAKLLDVPPLSTISKLNNFIEMTPRLAEYIASREAGRSVEVSMLDAARVTTNFRAGGDITKFLNRNGATFLNASVQGAMQQVRNVREAKANGMKGWANLATKFIAAGLPALILNHLIWDDDEEYEELADYVKQNYYIVAKTGDGKFIRIPKGRTMAVIQDAFEQVSNALTGDDEVDMKSFLELVVTNLSPNNPIENNILAPIIQVANNETWYGEDLVPQRLADLPAAEQFDESTDAFSKWLGGKLNISPVKINYLLDQYSGGAGDVVLPMMTPEAESGDNSLVGNLLAPLKSKFTADSVMNNQNVSDFYDTKDELTTEAKKSAATDTDIIKSKYMNSINAQLSKLYAEKREIQNSDLSDDVKYDMVRRVQNQIVDLTREALEVYESVTFSDGHAMVSDLYFKKNEDGEWQKLSDDQVTKYEITSAAGNSSYATDGNVHFRWYQKEGDADGEWRKITDKELEKQNEVTSALGISASDYWSNKDEYDYAYEYPENYAVAKAVGGYDSFRAYASELNDIPADKDADGKSISGSRKAKVVEYINGLDADYGEKLVLFKSEYNGDDTYNYEIVDYLNSRDDISYEDMVVILKKLGFTVSADGDISW